MPSVSQQEQAKDKIWETHGHLVYTIQACLEVKYSAIWLRDSPYNKVVVFRVVGIQDTRVLERLAGLGVIVVVSGRHIEKF